MKPQPTNLPQNHPPSSPIRIVVLLLIFIAIVTDSSPAQVDQHLPYDPHSQARTSLLTDDWQRQHPIQLGWYLRSVSVVDSMHTWACGWHDSAAGLVVRTSDGGVNWSEVTRILPLNVNDICFVTDSLGWVVGGFGSQSPGFVMRTTNRGQSWATQTTVLNVVFRSVFFLDAMRGWVCGDSGKILATTNAGANWQTQASGRRTSFQDVFLFPNGRGWCGPPVLRTTDFGVQWDSISNISLNQFSFLDDSLGWAVASLPPLPGFNWRTTDGGRTWTEGLRLTDVYPTDVAMLSDSLVLSTMWDSRVDPPMPYYPISMRNLTRPLPPIETRALILWGLAFAKTGHGFAVGLDEIVSSNDSGRTWINRIGPQTSNIFSIDLVNDSVGWVVGDRELIMKTTDGGRNWKSQTPARLGALSALSAIDRDHAFAGGGVFMATTDGGTTWSRTSVPGVYGITGLSFLDMRQGWAATPEYKILHTIDGGTNWTEQAISSRIWGIDFVDSSYGWCVGEGVVYGTTNGGLAWTVQASRPVLIFWSIDFVDRNHGWAAGEHLILRTTNGGAHWFTSDSTIHAGYQSVHFVNRDTGWAVGDQGRIIATTNGGVTWIVQYPGGGPNDPGLYSVDAVSSQLVWISGESSEILHTTNGGGLTYVRMMNSQKPERFLVEQNYPNPFNPSTTINFAVPSRVHVSLRVYSIIGKEVATLADGFVDAGFHQVALDATNIASGVYFYRLSAGPYTSVKKLVVLK